MPVSDDGERGRLVGWEVEGGGIVMAVVSVAGEEVYGLVAAGWGPRITYYIAGAVFNRACRVPMDVKLLEACVVVSVVEGGGLPLSMISFTRCSGEKRVGSCAHFDCVWCDGIVGVYGVGRYIVGMVRRCAGSSYKDWLGGRGSFVCWICDVRCLCAWHCV
ncbi:hypothetical protein Tco_0615791 [Tanacetum coccineum]